MVAEANKSSVSPLAVIRSLPKAAPPKRKVSVVAATGYVGAAVLGSASVIEVVRAFVAAPGALSQSGEFLGGSMVALFVLAAVGLLTRARELGGVSIASSFALLAYGSVLVFQSQAIGILFVGLAPIVGVLTHITFRSEENELPVSYKIDIAWAVAKCRAQTARAAERAVSRNPLATLA